jgi:hypothetical protein
LRNRLGAERASHYPGRESDSRCRAAEAERECESSLGGSTVFGQTSSDQASRYAGEHISNQACGCARKQADSDEACNAVRESGCKSASYQADCINGFDYEIIGRSCGQSSCRDIHGQAGCGKTSDYEASCCKAGCSESSSGSETIVG